MVVVPIEQSLSGRSHDNVIFNCFRTVFPKISFFGSNYVPYVYERSNRCKLLSPLKNFGIGAFFDSFGS